MLNYLCDIMDDNKLKSDNLKQAEKSTDWKERHERKDMKLKDAEKTIANKDVIIRMLQEQIKKLEESYKQNLRETEDYRYKFCVASEQIKRLRICEKEKCEAKAPEKHDEDKEIKALKDNICKVKQKYNRCTSASGEGNANQIETIEKFMKVYYELLKTLVDKVAERSSVPPAVEPKEEDKEEIKKLQEELDRLEKENAHLQEEHRIRAAPKATDSILTALRITNEELHKKLLTGLIPPADQSTYVEMDNIESELLTKRHSFSAPDTSCQESRGVCKPGLKQDSHSVANEIEPKWDEPHSPTRVSIVITPTDIAHQATVDVEYDRTEAEAEIRNKSEDKFEENDEERAAVQLETTPQDTASAQDQIAETIIRIKTKIHVSVTKTDTGSMTEDASYQLQELTLANTTMLLAPDHFKETETSTDVQCDNCSTADCKVENATRESREEAKNQTEQFADIVEKILNDCEQEVAKQDKTEKHSDLNDMAKRLDEIKDTVTKLLYKQMDTHKEIELLKGEMAVAHDSTKACNENLSRLQETIDQQKETFLINFQEHKAVTDNLTQVNDKIQKELTQLKENMDLLFENFDDGKIIQNGQLVPEDAIAFEECKKEIRKEKFNDTSDEDKKATISTLGIPSKTQTEQKKECPPTNTSTTSTENENPEDGKEMKHINEVISQVTERDGETTDTQPKKSDEAQTQSDECLQECPCSEDDMRRYLDQIRNENVTLKTTISAIVANLNEKLRELKNIKVQKDTRGNVCKCAASPTSYRCECQRIDEFRSSSFTGSDLEIEDIYDIIRRTYVSREKHSSSTSCFYTNMNVVPSCACHCPDILHSEQDVYHSMFGLCGSRDYNLATGPSRDSGPSKSLNNIKRESCIGTERCVGSDHSLFENLQGYVSYLYEQLGIISSIESRIEDLRCDVQGS